MYVLLTKNPHKIKMFETIESVLFYLRYLDKSSVLCILRDGKDITKEFVLWYFYYFSFYFLLLYYINFLNYIYILILRVLLREVLKN